MRFVIEKHLYQLQIQNLVQGLLEAIKADPEGFAEILVNKNDLHNYAKTYAYNFIEQTLKTNSLEELKTNGSIN